MLYRLSNWQEYSKLRKLYGVPLFLEINWKDKQKFISICKGLFDVSEGFEIKEKESNPQVIGTLLGIKIKILETIPVGFVNFITGGLPQYLLRDFPSDEQISDRSNFFR